MIFLAVDEVFSEIGKWAAGTGLGGGLLVLIARYFKGENEKMRVQLELISQEKLAAIQTRYTAEIDLLKEQNKVCQDDRKALHSQLDLMQEKLDKMKDQIIEIYKSRHQRMVVEQLKAETSDPKQTGKIPPLVQ